MYMLNISYKQFYITLNEIWLYESDPNAPSTCSEPSDEKWQHSIRGWRNSATVDPSKNRLTTEQYHAHPNTVSWAGREGFTTGLLAEALAYRQYFKWTRHENMSLCTANRANADNERITSWVEAHSWTSESQKQLSPPTAVASRPWPD